MRQRAELLAPAGSVETMYAAFAAGADAVYIGGSRFGARAYADNAESEPLLEAIDYAHLHGKKLYLTVNTLLKEQEMGELYAYLLPFYRQGLDAVIVQDFGVFRRVREWFPDLPIHASTQMTMSGALSALKLKELGATRIVTPRELSLEEIRCIHESCDLEIESFVHGALCYCYSGQCLFSSIVGGRSGNRGRCAQPCRMAYTVEQDAKVILPQQKGYILSPKDLCTIEILPQLIEAGIYSLKIEGRMKKPEYTAGVVSIYRKYLDRYLANPTAAYRVSEADKKHLLGLFNRKGFTDGYYTKHNGSSMMTYTAPDFRAGEDEFLEKIRTDYIGIKLKENIKGTVKIYQGKPAILSVIAVAGKENLTDQSGKIQKQRMQGQNDYAKEMQNQKMQSQNDYANEMQNQKSYVQQKEVTVSAGLVQEAKSRPLTKELIQKQMEKLGDTDFSWESLTIETDDASFCPVGVLNELRRNAIGAIKNELLSVWRREAETEAFDEKTSEVLNCETNRAIDGAAAPKNDRQDNKYSASVIWHASVETMEQFTGLLTQNWIHQVTIDSHICEPDGYAKLVRSAHEADKTCYLYLPKVFRQEDEPWYQKHREIIVAAGFDGILASTPEAWLFAQKYLLPGKVAADHSLYTWNTQAAEELASWGSEYRTLSVELNRRELEASADQNSELIVYGRIPMMVSAQCICKNTVCCKKQPVELTLVDRMKNRFPVKNVCRECYNVIYNSLPLSLADQWSSVRTLPLRGYRLSFTTETRKQMQKVLTVYGELACTGKTLAKLENTTRGHYKRGAE